MAKPFMKINGKAFPMPGRHPTLRVATMVSSARNTLAEMVGQKIGRDQYKVESLFWPHLTAEEWSAMLKEFNNFFVIAEIPDMVNNCWMKLKMYPGDRTAEPWMVSEETGLPTEYINCKVNIIDVGVLEVERHA